MNATTKIVVAIVLAAIISGIALSIGVTGIPSVFAHTNDADAAYNCTYRREAQGCERTVTVSQGTTPVATHTTWPVVHPKQLPTPLPVIVTEATDVASSVSDVVVPASLPNTSAPHGAMTCTLVDASGRSFTVRADSCAKFDK